MAICARCTGGYLGVVVGTVMILSHPNYPHLRILLLGLLLFILGVGDVFFEISLDIDGPNAWRFLTGLLGGLGSALLVIFFVFYAAARFKESNTASGETWMKSLILAAIGATSILISNPVNAREFRIPAGTIVVVQTLGAISSETAQPGDIVETHGGF
jgi:uncharacterized membrane protein